MSPVVLLAWPPTAAAWALVDDAGGRAPDERVVVVHGGVAPSAAAVAALCTPLADAGVDAVATAAVVTDAVKQVDERGTVVGEVPRDGLARLVLPQALSVAALRGLAGSGPPASQPTPARQLLDRGGVVRTISAPSG